MPNSRNTMWPILIVLFSWTIVINAQKNPAEKCGTVPFNEKLNDKYPGFYNVESFEKWMSGEVEKLKSQSEEKSMATYTIPVIFHVIHNGEAEGATGNVGYQYIQAQLAQINLDFANLSGSTQGAAADIDMDFCFATVDESGTTLSQPGVNRINRNTAGFTAPPWTDTYLDNTVLPATQWDPDQYCNIWVVDISGGILGYAQFPEAPTLPGVGTGNGPANTDGVVILYTNIGGISNPFPGSSPYDLGRTLTHELGHWLGLRHIWGDDNCGNDYCADTPAQETSSSGCPNTTTCDGNQDMVQNYMDYSDDSCMNTFTNDQKSRMHVVMGATGNPSPRRAILNTSTVCSGGSSPPTCQTYQSSDVGQTSSTVITSDVIIPAGLGTLSDVNVLGIDITHDWINDVVIKLTSPTGTTQTLLSQVCDDENNLLLSLDDAGTAYASIPCPPTNSMTYKPLNPLSLFNGEDPTGTWTLTIEDVETAYDDPTLNAWSLEVCVPASGCQNTLDLSGTLSDPLYQASQTINAAGTVPGTATVILRAGNDVNLNTNFDAALGCTLTVEIGGCQ